jgi:hypothetical protein
MSCPHCDDAQENLGSAFYRWGKANIEVNGCDEHLQQVFSALDFAREQGIKPDSFLTPRTIFRVKKDI